MRIFNQTDRWVQLDMVMPTFEVLVGTGKKNAYHSTTKVRVSDTKLSVDDDGLGIVKILMHFPGVLSLLLLNRDIGSIPSQ